MGRKLQVNEKLSEKCEEENSRKMLSMQWLLSQELCNIQKGSRCI